MIKVKIIASVTNKFHIKDISLYIFPHNFDDYGEVENLFKSESLGSSSFNVLHMVFIIDGYSFHYAHTWSKSGISIC